MAGVGVCFGENMHSLAAEHETEEALGCFGEVAGEHQPFIEGRVGGSKDDRMLSHGDQDLSSDRHDTRFFIVVVPSLPTASWNGQPILPAAG